MGYTTTKKYYRFDSQPVSVSDYNVAVQEYYTRRKIWEEKPQIRLVYKRWVNKILPFLTDKGPLLEVGSGSGQLRDLIPDIILSDVVYLSWLDCVANCIEMPFDDGSLGGVIGMDLLHHLVNPHIFMREAARILRPGGRAIFIEPYITLLSFSAYKLLHHEDIYFRDYQKKRRNSDIWEGNLALANLVFNRDLKNWYSLQPNLAIVYSELFSFFDFACAAGFKPYAYAPHFLFRILARMDAYLSILMPFIGFRIFVVLERI
jgi:hypothetical protein